MKKIVIALVLCIFLFSLASFVYAEQERNAEMNGIKNTIQELKQELKDDFQQLKEKSRELKQDIKDFSVNIKELLRERKEIRLELNGKNMTIKELTENIKEIIAERMTARTGLNLTAEDIDNKTMLKAYLSNGRNAIIKVMPDTASEKAIERLKLKMCNETNNCTIELKETGEGNQTRAVYEVKARKEKRFWFFWKKKVEVKTEIDAEEVVSE